MISDKAAADAVFVPDGGSSRVWTVRYMRTNGGGRVLSSFNHGSIGVGFGMAPQDLVTAKRFGWPVKVVILNNRQYAFVKMEMEVAGLPEDSAATDVVNMDFVAYAKACGADGVRVERPQDLSAAIDRAIDAPGPFVLDVSVTPGILVMPPHIVFDEAAGFAFSKFKEGLLAFDGDHAQFEGWIDEFRANLE
jgi:pyruvate dehydrogenase (quinone)